MNNVNENAYPLDRLSIDRASQLANIEYPFTSDSYQSIKGKVKSCIYGKEDDMQAQSRSSHSNMPNAQAALDVQDFQDARGAHGTQAMQAVKNPNRRHHFWRYLLVAAFAASLVFAVGFVAFNPNLGIWRNWLSYTSDAGDTGLDSLNSSVSSIGTQIEDQGIRIELNSALCDGVDTYYMFKITDMEGDRLGENINLNYMLRASNVGSDGNASGYPVFTGGAHQVGYDGGDNSITYMIFADDDLVGKNVNIQISAIDIYEPGIDAAENSIIKGSWDFDCTINDYAALADTGQINVDTPAGRVFNVVVSPASINLYHEYHEAGYADNVPIELELVYEDGTVVPVSRPGRSQVYSGFSVGEGGSRSYDGYTGDKDLSYAYVLDPNNDEFVARSTVNILIDRIDDLKAIRVNGVEIPIAK